MNEQKKPNNEKKLLLYHKYFIMKVFFIAIVIFIAMAASTLDKPLTLDEATFGKAWKDMHIHGPEALGIVNLDQEENSLQYKNLEHQLAHPPLWRLAVYFYSEVFGLSNFALRFFGILCLIISLFYLYKILNLYYNTSSDKLFLLASSIILIHPYLSIASMAVHIDTMLLPTVFFIFTYYFLKLNDNNFKHLIYLGILYGICLWTKELLAAFLTISLGLYYLFQKRYKSAFVKTGLITAVGILFFSVTWGIVSWYYGIPFEGWFYETIWKKVINLGFQKETTSLIKYLFLVSSRFFWKTIFYNLSFLMLIAISMYFHIKDDSRNKKYDFIYIFIITQFVIFTFYFYMNTYYLYSALMIGVILIAQLIYQMQVKVDKKYVYYFIGLFIYYLCFGNPAIKIQRFWLDSVNAGKLIIFPEIYHLIGYLILYFTPLLLTLFIFILRKISLNVVIGLLILIFLSSSLAFNVFQLQDYSTAVLWNNYGEEGFEDTLIFLDENIKNETTIVTRKDFEYYLLEDFKDKDITYIYNKFLRTNNEARTLEAWNNIDYSKIDIVTTDMYTKPKNDKLFNTTHKKVFESGDFAVYQK